MNRFQTISFFPHPVTNPSTVLGRFAICFCFMRVENIFKIQVASNVEITEF